MTTRRQHLLTRRQYYLFKVMLGGVVPNLAVEAVATTALEHPEWDMEEARTWGQWEEEDT